MLIASSKRHTNIEDIGMLTHRPGFYYYYASGGKDKKRKREVKINMVRRLEEGEVDTLSRSVEELEGERMKRDMEALLWKKEEELVAAKQGVNDQDGVTVEVAGVARGIYPVLNSQTSPV